MNKPTKYEKDNLPLDVRMSYNKAVKVYKSITNYELAIISEDEFIETTRKAEEKYTLKEGVIKDSILPPRKQTDSEILLEWKETSLAQFIETDGAMAGQLIEFAKFYHGKKTI